MKELRQRKVDYALKKFIETERPLFGICLKDDPVLILEDLEQHISYST